MENNNLKVLFFGVFSKDSTNISQANAFERNGCEVTRHDFRANPQLPEDKGYDLIFYSKCNELGIDAVDKYKGIKCLWYMDSMNGNYNDSLKAKFSLVDFITFALYDPWVNSQHYATPCYLIEEGFDPDVDIWNYRPYIHDVSFIGNLYNKSRQDYRKEIEFDIIKCSRIDHPIRVRYSKINLNFTDGGTSDRAYKVMAAGGFLLSESWPGCPFDDGIEFDTFENSKELKQKIKYYLRNQEKRIEIAEAGYKAVQKFSRTNWAKRILDIYKNASHNHRLRKVRNKPLT